MIDTSRRRLLAATASGVLLSACAPLRPPRDEFPRLAPAKISADRVIRVLVGLRPYRASGFVVRADTLGAKRLIHNYGHGGGGITLSWGTSELAVGMGFDGGVHRYAVLGCGVIGLTTATLLQRRGAAVTIYAKALPPDTTSNIAGGHWSPYSVFDSHVATAPFLDQFHRATRISYRHFQALAGPRYGVSWRRDYVLTDEAIPPGTFRESLRDVMPAMASFPPGEHPFGDAHVQTFMSMMIEPHTFLRALMDSFLLAGGRVELRDFASAEAVATLPETVIFNCTGLGARALFGDEELQPARGQLVVLVPQPEVDYNLFSSSFYMFPRTDGILLGGTFERGQWSLEPDPAATTRIIEGNARAMARLTT